MISPQIDDMTISGAGVSLSRFVISSWWSSSEDVFCVNHSFSLTMTEMTIEITKNMNSGYWVIGVQNSSGKITLNEIMIESTETYEIGYYVVALSVRLTNASLTEYGSGSSGGSVSQYGFVPYCSEWRERMRDEYECITGCHAEWDEHH